MTVRSLAVNGLKDRAD